MKSVDELPLEEVVRLAEQMLKIRAVLEAGANHYERDEKAWHKVWYNSVHENPMNEADAEWLHERSTEWWNNMNLSGAKKEAFLEMIELIDSKKF